jgi:hypothetical protein
MNARFRHGVLLAAVCCAPGCGASTKVADGGARPEPITGAGSASPGEVRARRGAKCDGSLALTAGQWKDITPPGLDLKSKSNHSYGANDVQIDPENPCVLYASFDMRGLYKSTTSGSSWTKIGTLDSPLHLRIDPRLPEHLYAVQGVRGATQGFWISKDGGETWTLPRAFADLAKTRATLDAYYLDVDPADFDHVIVTSHGYWVDQSNGDSGILESKDGGTTWRVVFEPGWSHGNCAWFMDSNTWLLGTQDHGYFRTTDGGRTWSNVYSIGMTHGGVELYRSPTGAYYAGALQFPIRSADFGATWSQVKEGLPYASYGGIVGDGDLLYTSSSCACDGEPFDNPYFTAPEKEGTPWTAYRAGAQKFKNGPYDMALDKTRGILYSANWDEGVWALRIVRAAQKGP